MSERLSGEECRLYKERLVQSTLSAIQEKPDTAAVEDFARLLSTDIEFQRSLAKHWTKKLVAKTGCTIEDVVTTALMELFAHDMRIEVVTRGSDPTNATLFLFGTDRPFYSIPLSLLRCNSKAMAYFLRVVFQGQTMPGSPMFLTTTCSGVSSEIVSKGFSYNATFGNTFSRAAVLLSMVACLSSSSACSSAYDKEYDYYRLMRTVLLSATGRLHTSLSDESFRSMRPWLNPREVFAVCQVFEHCQDDETFAAHSLLSIQAKNIDSMLTPAAETVFDIVK